MKLFNWELSVIKLLRAETHSYNEGSRRYLTLRSLSPSESVAQTLQMEFGSVHGDLRTPLYRVPGISSASVNESMKTVNDDAPGHELKHGRHNSHPLGVEVNHGHDNPHPLGVDDNPHSPGLDVKHDLGNLSPHVHADTYFHRHDDTHTHGHAHPHPHDLEVKLGHDNTRPHVHDNAHPHVAEPFVSFTKSSQDIIKLLINKVNTQSWIALDREMQAFKIEMKPKEVAWVLRVLKNPRRAWDLFKWASQRPGYAHDGTCYSIMIDLLGQCPDHSLLNDLLAEMEKRKIQYSLTTVNRLIGIYAAHEDIDKAEHYFLKLQNLGIQPTAYTYKCMLQAFAKAHKCEKALEIYRVMQKEQQPMDNISYNILLDGLSRNSQVETAQNIFEEMKGCGNLADVYTYTIMARTYGHSGMIGKALDLLEEMVRNGVQPNKHTYNTILAASQDRLEDAIKLFKKMSVDGVYPDALSCQSILKVLCKVRQVSQTVELTQCIKQKSVRKEVCETFIKVLGRMGYLRDMRALFQSLKADNLRPSQATCLSMINALCRAAEPNEALVILKEAEDKAGPLPLTTYNTIIAALRNGNQFKAAYDLFKKIKEMGPSPDVVSYNIIIAGLAKAGKLPLAEGLFEEMVRLGCMPNVITFNSLLHSFARLGDVSSTRKLLHMMHNKEVTPDVVTYNCTIECFGKAGKPKVALKVFNEMKEKGCSPSFVTYNNVLAALTKACLTDEVLSLFGQMKEQGFMPDAMTFTILGRLYDSNPQLDKKWLVEEIRKAGLAYEIIV